MRKSSYLWQAAFVIGISALAVPAFATDEEMGEKTGFEATAPEPQTGTQSPQTTGSGEMEETDRTGTTGPSGSRPFSTESGAVPSAERVAKPAGDYAVTTADRELAARIRTVLQGDPELFGVGEDTLHIKVDNGAVTLEGNAASETIKEQISEKVKTMAGVRSLDNQMQIVSTQQQSMQ